MNYGLPPETWDKKLQQRAGSFLQSRSWATFQEALGRRPVWDEGKGWQWLAAVRRSNGLQYLLCGYGPTADSPQSMKAAIQSLAAAGRTLGVDFVRLEPQQGITVQQLQSLGARKIAEADPEHTRILDVTVGEQKLRSDLASGHRNLINGIQRRGIVVRRSNAEADFKRFLQMLHDTARRSKVRFYPDSYYRQLWETLGSQNIARLYVAEAGGEPVAAALFYDWGGTRYYAHAGADQVRNREVKASVSLVWQAILDAGEVGSQRFDLWGVAPEGDASHPLAALSRFKQAFGGTEVDYLGTWDLPLKKAKYGAYRVYRRLRGRD